MGKATNPIKMYATKKEEALNKDKTLPLRIVIFREIYKFCLIKQIKRVEKWFMLCTSQADSSPSNLEVPQAQVVTRLKPA